jgi:hypothetical protein
MFIWIGFSIIKMQDVIYAKDEDYTKSYYIKKYKKVKKLLANED